MDTAKRMDLIYVSSAYEMLKKNNNNKPDRNLVQGKCYTAKNDHSHQQ